MTGPSGRPPRRTVPLSRPAFGEEERAAALRPLESGWVVQGPFVAEFEEKFRRFVDVQHASAMTSCTTALHAAILALGCGPGDEVIVPAFTWIATANVVEAVGARPVFCDVDLDTFNINPDAAAAAVTSRTVGILPVHLFGLAADMGRLLDIARRASLWVVEDAACGLGARYRGRHVGTFGEIGCFSFHPRKSITTGEGGMAVTNDPAIAARLLSLRDHGADHSSLDSEPDPARMPEYRTLGFNYRMTDIQGAIGSAQMDRVASILGERRRLARAYDSALAELDVLASPVVPDGYEHGYQSYVCRVGDTANLEDIAATRARRDGLIRTLSAAGVGCRPGTHAPALSAYYRERYGTRPDDVPMAAMAEAGSIALPMFAGLQPDDIQYVVEVLDEWRRSS